MDTLVQRQIQLVASKIKSSVPWETDKPFPQVTHSWDVDSGQWQSSISGERPSTAYSESGVQSLALYSWNIDFMLPFADSRMRAAIRHLKSHVTKQDPSAATVIFLNECLDSDMELITSDAWVRKTFQLTDLDGTNWQSGHYGTTTLIDKRLPIQQCFRVHYEKTRMERDGLFVDITLPSQDQPKIIRLCNTHLESLANEPAFRPPQLKLCAEYMHDKAVYASILAGDLNAIQPFDRTLHSGNNLKDAFLELGGDEDDAEAGHTWGQQTSTALRERFGTSRMDKVFFCGGVECKSFERFGADVEVDYEGEKEELVGLGFERGWVTDHLGVKAVFELAA